MSTTYGSQTSSFPDSLPTFTAQSEALDPASQDSTLAEGRDANKWSAEIASITKALGTGGRGQVSVTATTATVEGLKYIYNGTQYSYAGTNSLSLYSGQVNYIYLDCRDNTAKVSTSSWPTTQHIRLAIWDDSGESATLTDSRPHDLGIAARKPLESTTAAQVMDSGTATVENGNTSIAVSFNLTFTAAPVFVCSSRRPSDSTQRKIDFSNLTTTGATIYIDTAAPAAGAVVHWMAIGIEDTSGSGS